MRKISRAKAYLMEKADEIRHMDGEIVRKKDRLRKLRARLTDGTAMLTGMPGGGGGENKTTERLTELVAMADEIEQSVAALAGAQRRLLEEIRKVESADLCGVLELRYIDGLRWTQIARKMGYSVDNVYKIHGKALTRFEAVSMKRKKA